MKAYIVQGFAAEYVGSVLGGVWSVESAGKWANDWSDFAPNVLSISSFPGLKILSQKCLLLKSLVFRELAGNVERILKKHKRKGRERKREEERGRDEGTKRQRDKETKRQREEERKRGRERKKEEKRGRDKRRKAKGPSF